MTGPDSPQSAFRRAAEAGSFEQTQDALSMKTKHTPGRAARAAYEAAQSNALDAQRWRAMRQTLVAEDFAPEMGGGPVVMFACHAERVGFGPEGADAIADAAVAAMNGANGGVQAPGAACRDRSPGTKC